MMQQSQTNELLTPRKSTKEPPDDSTCKERKIIRNIKSMSRTHSINYESLKRKIKINLNSHAKLVKNCARKNDTHGEHLPTIKHIAHKEEKTKETTNDNKSKQGKGKNLFGKIKTCGAKRIQQTNQSNGEERNDMNSPCVDAQGRNSCVKRSDTNHAKLKNMRQLHVDLQLFLRNAQYLNDALVKRDTLQSNQIKKENLKTSKQKVDKRDMDLPDCAGDAVRELVKNEQFTRKGEMGTEEPHNDTHQQCDQSFTQGKAHNVEVQRRDPQTNSSTGCYQLRHTTAKGSHCDAVNKHNLCLVGTQKRREKKCRQRDKNRNRRTPSSGSDGNNIGGAVHVRKRMKRNVHPEGPLEQNDEHTFNESASGNTGNSNDAHDGDGRGIPGNPPYDHVDNIIDRVNLNGTQPRAEESSTKRGDPSKKKKKNFSLHTKRVHNIKDIIDRNVLTNFIKCVNKQYMNGKKNESNQVPAQDGNAKKVKRKLFPLCTPACSKRGVTCGSKAVDRREENKDDQDHVHVEKGLQDAQCAEEKQHHEGKTNVHVAPYDRLHSAERDKRKKPHKRDATNQVSLNKAKGDTQAESNNKDPSKCGPNIFANFPITSAGSEKEIGNVVKRNSQGQTKSIKLSSFENQPAGHSRGGYNHDHVTYEKGNPCKEAIAEREQENNNMATEKLNHNLAFNEIHDDESSALINKYHGLLLQNLSKPPHVDETQFEKCKYCVLHILNQHREEDGGHPNGTQNDSLLCNDDGGAEEGKQHGLQNGEQVTANTAATKAGIYQDIAHIGDLTKTFKGNYESLKNYLNNLNKKKKNVQDYLLNLYCYAYIRQCAVSNEKVADGQNTAPTKEEENEENEGETNEKTIHNHMNNNYGKDNGDSATRHFVKAINEKANTQEKGINSTSNLLNDGRKIPNGAPSNGSSYSVARDVSANGNKKPMCRSATKEDSRTEHMTDINPLHVKNKHGVHAQNGEIKKILCRYYNYLKLKNYIIPYNMYNHSMGVTKKESNSSGGGANDKSNDQGRQNSTNGMLEEDLINISYNFITEHRGPNKTLTYDHFCNFHRREFFKKRTHNILNKTDEAATKKGDEPNVSQNHYDPRLMQSYTYDGHHSMNTYKKKNNGNHFYLFKYLIENMNREELQKLMLCQCCYVLKKIENKMTPLDVILDTQILFHDCNRYFKNQGWVDNNGIPEDRTKLESHNLEKGTRADSRTNVGDNSHMNPLHRNALAKLHNGVGLNGGKTQNKTAAPTRCNPSKGIHHANSSSRSNRSSVHIYNFENHEVSMTSTTASMSWQGKGLANEKNRSERKWNEQCKRKNDKGRNNHIAGKAEKENKEKVQRYQKARGSIDRTKFESALFKLASRKLRGLQSQGKNIYIRGKRMADATQTTVTPE
ncbi:hypothetical protein AK88_01915 [Plasmodium fragile]|uniref:Uncharacterized protein n=1 Tax=Plasmodium fragile TaxID=5857 RepID=A0A0D9QNE7_PLAFR|nr:uncharacterized protein AK88_01915 [Plasmodium fragile]KJP88463.1 hypothetical protein AK88_01915 [Plasmodium fragile]